jgi:hypothetical protein
MPQVIMAAEPQRVRVLAGHAEQARCGVESMEGGLVCVYAASVRHLHALAQAMLDARAELERLPPPAWLPRVQEYLTGDDSDEFEWTDDEIGWRRPEVDLGRALNTTIVTWAAGSGNRNRGRS